MGGFLTALLFLGIIVLLLFAGGLVLGWFWAVITAGPATWFWMAVIFLFWTGVRSS